MTVSSHVVPCSLIATKRRFRDTCFLRHQRHAHHLDDGGSTVTITRRAQKATLAQ
jgi:hypothetical protein